MRLKHRVILTLILVIAFLLTVFIVNIFSLGKEKEYRGTFAENIRWEESI